MDRQIAHAILFAVACTALLSLYFFAGSAQSDNPAFAPDDIRFNAQQEKLKSQKRKKTVSAAPSTSTEDSVEETESEEPLAEEPEIE